MNTYIFPGAELPTMPLGSVVCICFVFPRESSLPSLLNAQEWNRLPQSL